MGAVHRQAQTIPPERTLDGRSVEGTPSDGARPMLLPLSLRLHRDMAPLEKVWRALEADDRLSVHQSYDWCRAWAGSHGADLLILEGVADGQTQLILPLELTTHGPFRLARFLGADFSNINTGLAGPAFLSADDHARLSEALENRRAVLAQHCDALMLERVPLVWRGEPSALSGLPAVLNQNASFQLDLVPDFAQTLAQLNARSRRVNHGEYR